MLDPEHQAAEPSSIASSSSPLESIFNARSVVVVGVSDDRRKQSRVVLRNLLGCGFQGRVYGISRSLSEVDGVRCFGRAGDLPEAVDVAFLSLPAAATPAALRELAEAKVKAAIIGSAGFAESGDTNGAALQEELRGIARETGIRVVGPNCNGIYNAHAPLSIGFNTGHSRRLATGGVAILSHSGALFDPMMSLLQKAGGGLSFFVSAGNEADLDLLAYLEYAIGHRETRVIAMLVDSLADGDRFRRLADRATQHGKSIVVLQIGVSDVGAKAAIAHSSRMAGSPQAYAALYAACGVPTVTSLEGLMTAAAMLSLHGRAPGGLGAFSTSGAGSSILADMAARFGIPLPPFTAQTLDAVASIGAYPGLGNPLDLGNFQGRPRREELQEIIARDTGVGAVVGLMQSLALAEDGGPHLQMKSSIRARTNAGKPVIIITPGGQPETERSQYEAGGVSVLPDTQYALESIAAMLLPLRRYPQLPGGACTPTAARRDLLALQRPLTEPESLELLGNFGVQTVETHVCSSVEQAIEAAQRIGWPVVVKAVMEGVAHKSDLGLVRIGIASAEALRTAWAELGAPAVAVQRMIKGQIEVIAGVSRIPGAGQFLLVGLGGIYAEALGVSLLIPIPAERSDIESALRTSPLGRILTDARWQDPSSLARLTDALWSLQAFACWAGADLEAVDINPLIVGSAGVVAVDALVVPARAGAAASSTH